MALITKISLPDAPAPVTGLTRDEILKHAGVYRMVGPGLSDTDRYCYIVVTSGLAGSYVNPEPVYNSFVFVIRYNYVGPNGSSSYVEPLNMAAFKHKRFKLADPEDKVTLEFANGGLMPSKSNSEFDYSKPIKIRGELKGESPADKLPQMQEY